MSEISFEAPHIVKLGVEDAIKLRELGKQFDETAIEYVEGSLGLVGLWGFIIELESEKADERPAIEYGITVGEEEFHVFDMTELLATANELYVDRKTQDPILDCRIPDQLRPYLTTAAEYYGAEFNPLLSLAIGIRKRCLEGLRDHETVHYTVNEWLTDTHLDLRQLDLTAFSQP